MKFTVFIYFRHKRIDASSSHTENEDKNNSSEEPFNEIVGSLDVPTLNGMVMIFHGLASGAHQLSKSPFFQPLRHPELANKIGQKSDEQTTCVRPEVNVPIQKHHRNHESKG